MKKIGITGQSGFMGSHLYNFLRFKKEEFEMISFEDRFFEDPSLLKNFASQCDVIVHIAGMNRHGDPQVIYDTNVRLAKQLITAIDDAGTKPHVLFSSSTQEERDNPYGNSKREARKLLIEWAEKNNSKFTGLVIPNVFGPFGNPFYNSVIATFSHQLTHDQEPKIEIDANIKLIYINDLVDVFYKIISEEINANEYVVPHGTEIKVTDILKKLQIFKETYIKQNIIPELKDAFDISLFNTFKGYLDYSHYPVVFTKHADNRGELFEILKTNTKGQIFFSYTRPGITRGNHFHRRKIERFIVVQGEAIIRFRKIGTKDIIEYNVSGEKPSSVDIPIHHTHNISNIGKSDLITLFCTNEFFNPDDSDTYFEEV